MWLKSHENKSGFCKIMVTIKTAQRSEQTWNFQVLEMCLSVLFCYLYCFTWIVDYSDSLYWVDIWFWIRIFFFFHKGELQNTLCQHILELYLEHFLELYYEQLCRSLINPWWESKTCVTVCHFPQQIFRCSLLIVVKSLWPIKMVFRIASRNCGTLLF